MKNQNLKPFETVTFLCSKDYHLFNRLFFNREIDKAHVNTLVESMKLHGFLGVIQVIKTNIFDGIMRLYILDGQHRFAAAQQLNLAFNFQLKEFKDREEAVAFITELNNSQKGWGTTQFLDVWGGVSIPEYLKLKEVYQTTGFQITPLIEAYTFSGRMSDFRRGRLKFPNETESDKIVSHLVDLNPYLPTKAFCRRTILRLMRQKKYNHDKMKNAVKVYKEITGGFSENEQEIKKEFQKLIDANC